MEGCYYVRVFQCQNCLEFIEVKIPWGNTIEEYCKKEQKQVCPNCGCSTEISKNTHKLPAEILRYIPSFRIDN